MDPHRNWDGDQNRFPTHYTWGHGVLSLNRGRFPIVQQAVQTRYSGPPDETNDPPDEKVSAPEQGIWVGDLVDQGVLGFGGPAVGLGVPRNRSISASDEFRALEQFRK